MGNLHDGDPGALAASASSHAALWRSVRDAASRHASTLRAGATVDVLNATTWVACALAGLLGLLGLATRSHVAHRGELVGLALGALVAAVLVALLRSRLPLSAYHALCAGGSVAVGAAVVAYGNGHGLVLGGLLVFAAVAAACFFPVPAAAVQGAWSLACLVVAVGLSPGADAMDAVLAGGLLLASAGLVVVVTAAVAASGTDPLTGLPDRASMTRRLSRSLDQSVTTGDPVVFAIIGLDHFAQVNQVHGQVGGDALLRATAASWRALLPRGAVLGRWGGDQFAIVATSSVDDVWGRLRRLRAELPEGRTCSAGVVAVESGEVVEDVVDHADGALAAAKRTRRGTDHLWAPGTATGRGLLQALARGEVEVHYQPVVALGSGEVTGAEALVRWRRSDGSYYPPADFLPQAEASGSIIDLGRFVLATACADAAAWPQVGVHAPTVAVNAAGAELSHPEYAAWVVAALHRSGLPGERLVIEVVEGHLDEESPVVVENLHALRAAGVRLAVDDFGTGWSSLSRLGRLPLDILKVDRSFVATVEPGRDAPLCAGVVALAQALDLTLIAEGVEDEHQASWLRDLGCQEAQGWLWAPALPVEKFTARLTEQAAAQAQSQALLAQ